MKIITKAKLDQTTSRTDRRRIETRARLMAAAYNLISEIGADSIVIQAITERADVAFGSFYNYFKSKDEIVAAVLGEAVEHTADLLDRMHSDERRLDETLSHILQLFLKKCAEDHVWASFVARTIGTGSYFEWGFGRRLRRDIEAGIAAGIFRVRDGEIAILGVSGLMMAAILEIVAGKSDETNFSSRIVVLALKILGVQDKRIDLIISMEQLKIEYLNFYGANF